MIDRSVFETAENEGTGDPAQAGGRLVIAVTLDGDGEPLAEGLLRTQHARVEELHDRPEFGQAVLDRRAGHGDAPLGGDGPDALRGAGGAVLDLLCLVEDQPAPGHRGQQLLVAGGQAVGRQHQVHRPGVAGEGLPGEPVGPVVDVDGELRGEAGGLPLPVADEGHRADHQGRRQRGDGLPPLRRGRGGGLPGRLPGGPDALVDQQGQELGRLAQAHVVGQAGPEAEVAEEGQPAEAPFLIGAQLAGEAVRCDHGPEPPVVGPASRSPSQPSASTAATGRPPGLCSIPRAVRSTSPAVR